MATFQIEWKNSASKELEKLPRQIITRVVAAVDVNVFEKKLIVEIVRVRHRKDVYDK